MNEKQTSTAYGGHGTKPNSIKLGPLDEAVRPTKKQKELLDFIEKFIIEHGYSPSYREIMTGLDYKAVATVAQHVSSLIKRGHLRKRDHSARSLEVVRPSVSREASLNISTNEVKQSEEKWLVNKVQHLFAQAESGATVTDAEINDIKIVLAAMRILGLDGAAQSFSERLNTLKP